MFMWPFGPYDFGPDILLLVTVWILESFYQLRGQEGKFGANRCHRQPCSVVLHQSVRSSLELIWEFFKIVGRVLGSLHKGFYNAGSMLGAPCFFGKSHIIFIRSKPKALKNPKAFKCL